MTTVTAREELEHAIDAQAARLGIIGIGYVGLPLAVEFAKAGFAVTGFDIDTGKVGQLNAGESYVGDVPAEDLRRFVKAGTLTATTDFARLGDCEVAIICVPTPLRKTKDPDISHIIAACEQLVAHAVGTSKGGRCRLVVLESTTYPGTCEEVVLPMLAEARAVGTSKGGVGEEWFLCFSPERVDPGNAEFPTPKIPKVVGGITPACTALAARLYKHVFVRVVPVSSARVAETVKLLENTYRSVNIGLINEIALMCHAMGIDVWEVIEAAATKPFGFAPFRPGPGLGGHCIPIDPLLLSWKAKVSAKFNPKFIELAAEVNESMPGHVVERAAEILNERGKPLKGSKVLVLGVAYKRDVGDTRESPALAVIDLLLKKGAAVEYADPHVPALQGEGIRLEAVEPTPKRLAGCDLAIIITDHSGFDYAQIVEHAPVVFDTRNATGDLDGGGTVVKL